MRREGTSAWMQAVERRLEQAAEDARSRPVCGERARLHGCRWQSGVWNRPPRMSEAARRKPESSKAKRAASSFR